MGSAHVYVFPGNASGNGSGGGGKSFSGGGWNKKHYSGGALTGLPVGMHEWRVCDLRVAQVRRTMPAARKAKARARVGTSAR